MRALPLLLLVVFMSLGLAAYAQVGVEAGMLTAGSAATVDPLRQLGATLSRTVAGAAAAVPAGGSAPVAPTATSSAPLPLVTNTVTLSATQLTCTRAFTPTLAGRYVAGVRWSRSGTTPVALRANGQEATGTTAAPVTVAFTATAYSACSLSVRATAPPGQETVTGELEIVREPAAGETPSKSLLTLSERLTRRGCKPSLLPLLANLAERHLKGTTLQTDLDKLFDTALASAPAVSPADLQAFVRDFDALPATTRTQTITSATLALRSLAEPTVAAVRSVFASAGSSNFKPAITGLQPSPAGVAYPPGTTLHITGRNFGPVPERNEVYLGTDAANLLTQPPLAVASATPSELQFQIPVGLPDGEYHLLVMVDRRNMTAARPLQIAGNAPAPLAATQRAPLAHYRLRLLRLECVDETNPEWWGDDNVVLLATAVADGRATTHALGPLGGFADGVSRDMSGVETVLLGGDAVTEGIGLMVELWQWQAPPASAIGWALREAFSNALATPPVRFDNPKPQFEVAGELSVPADLIGREQLVWPAADLARLIPPGQKLSTVVELALSSDPARSDATGNYRATLELERVD